MMTSLAPSRGLTGTASFAIIFGIMTLVSGGRVLVDPAAQQEAGNYIGFIVWFNFLAGFFYITTGVGLWYRYGWARNLAWGIAITNLVMLILLGLYIFGGNLYEMRTVGAMIFRTLVWFSVAAIATQHGRAS